MEAKRHALDALSRGSERQGYDTNHDTKDNSVFTVAAQVIERNGRHEETRTPDLYRVKNLCLIGTDEQQSAEVAKGSKAYQKLFPSHVGSSCTQLAPVSWGW